MTNKSKPVHRRKNSSPFMPHSSFVTRHSSLVIRHSSFVTRHSSLVIRHSSLVIRHSSLVIRHSSLVIRHSSLLPFKCPILLSPKSFAAWKEFLFAHSLLSLRLGGECSTALSPRRRE